MKKKSKKKEAAAAKLVESECESDSKLKEKTSKACKEKKVNVKGNDVPVYIAITKPVPVGYKIPKITRKGKVHQCEICIII